MYQFTKPIFINLTKTCNFKCSYCYNNSQKTTSDNFVLRNWESIIKSISETDIKEVRLSGGEPLFLNEIEHICESIYNANISYTLTTNGALVNNHLDWLSKYSPSLLWISYHSEHYSFKTFYDLISKLSMLKVNLGINIFLDDITENSNLISLFASSSIKKIKILYKTPIGRANNRTIEKHTIDSSTLISLKRITKRNIDTDIRFESPLIANTMKGKPSCVLNERPLITIDNDGKVYPCCISILDKSSCIGDLVDNELYTILQNYNRIVNKLPCQHVLETVQSGKTSCPLKMININELV